MMLVRLDPGNGHQHGPLYWLPDTGVPRVEAALGGPFDTRHAAYTWLCCHLEDRFTGARKQLWADAVAQMGSRPDAAHLMGLAMMVAAGHAREHVLRAAQPIIDRHYARAA